MRLLPSGVRLVAETFNVGDTARLRDVIGGYMTDLGTADPRVVVVNADLMGTCRNRDFCETYPDRAFNVGIAEQDMVSFAAGLAHEGFIPYAFSMAPFVTMRACEQVRTDVAYAGVPVRLMGTYAGFSGGISGATHWALEDCAIMGSMGGMTVWEASDPNQAMRMLDASLDFSGPLYIRSGVEPVSTIYGSDYEFAPGKASVVREGSDAAIICSGVVSSYAAAASDILRKKEVSVRVVDMHCVKPIDTEAVADAAETGHVLVAQDHNIVGGLGYSVGTTLALAGLGVDFKILGAPDEFVPMAHAQYLYHKYGYDIDGLVSAVSAMLGLK